MNLVLHPATEKQLNDFVQQPSHALILIGSEGIGKLSIAEGLAQQLLQTDKPLAEQPYSYIVTPDEKGTISIEAVRELEQKLKLKVPSPTTPNRLIVIENSQALGTEAQNALLKTLEEPPAGTVLILTAPSSQDLLPTIISRTQQIAVKRPATSDLIAYFEQDYADKEVASTIAMTGGLPGLTQALLTDSEHPLKLAVIKARELLSQTTYERLLYVDELTKDRKLAGDIFFILQQMAHVSLQTAEGARAQQWQKIMTASYEASEALRANGQPKLVLDNFLLQI